MNRVREPEKIQLAHGGGGRLMHRLVREFFAPLFSMQELNDSAILPSSGGKRIALTTDSYVVSPYIFPGGDIGVLAVCGTVNDLSMAGARPLWLTAGFIIEEGFLLSDLKIILASMRDTAARAGVAVVAGDTKVVERGKGDGIYINTAGIGVVGDGVDLAPKKIRPGDRIILSAPIGDHGMSVMAHRSGITFSPPLMSDVKPLNGLVEAMLSVPDDQIRVLRDPTRGGLATTLKEFAQDSGYSLEIGEDAVPVRGEVRGACDLLGLDPLYVANEGVLVAVAGPGRAEQIVEAMRRHEAGTAARIIGTVREEQKQQVLLKTAAGGIRILDMISGEQLPRIC